MVRSTNKPSSVRQDGLRLNIGQIGKYLGFDLSGVDLRQGCSLVVAFQVRNKGEYRFSIEASSTLSELSQSPLAISLNGTTLVTWNVRGASEQIRTTLMNIGENVDNYLRLTLPLGGLRLGKAMLYPDDVHTPSE